jgi:hypothetical protein
MWQQQQQQNYFFHAAGQIEKKVNFDALNNSVNLIKTLINSNKLLS